MENLDVVTKDELHTHLSDVIKLGTTGLLCLTLYYYLTVLEFLQKDLHYHYIDMENLDVVTKDELHTHMSDGIKLGTTGLLCLTLYYYLTALQFCQKDLHYHYIDMENLDVVTKDELHTHMSDGIKLGTTGLLCLTLYYYLTALQFLQKDLHYHYIDMENLDVVTKDELHTHMSDGIKLGTVKPLVYYV